MRRLVLAVVLLALAPAAALAHNGNPNFLSQVDAITPATSGVTVDVLNRDDRLLLHNTSGKDVEIEGYEREPYARVRADGTVEVNTDSRAYYINDDRFANVDVPAGVDGKGPPQWKEIDKTGRFEWHDHRAHWMAKTTPPQVTDTSVKTKIFDWEVPVEIDGTGGAIAGTLFWTPLPGGGPPLTAIFAGAAVLIACCIAVAVIRYRRRVGAERPAREAEAW
ncbi:MAG TPA: hypothetical protein VK631_00505 [Solirubrobacteraceae bacterium]|nr:hypothetical protein [Solirubrobacteraceae bacterium]